MAPAGQAPHRLDARGSTTGLSISNSPAHTPAQTPQQPPPALALSAENESLLPPASAAQAARPVTPKLTPRRSLDSDETPRQRAQPQSHVLAMEIEPAHASPPRAEAAAAAVEEAKPQGGSCSRARRPSGTRVMARRGRAQIWCEDCSSASAARPAVSGCTLPRLRASPVLVKAEAVLCDGTLVAARAAEIAQSRSKTLFSCNVARTIQT